MAGPYNIISRGISSGGRPDEAETEEKKKAEGKRRNRRAPRELGLELASSVFIWSGSKPPNPAQATPSPSTAAATESLGSIHQPQTQNDDSFI